MARSLSVEPAAIGFRVKTGWAAAVLLTGPPAHPTVLDRRRVPLSDPAVPQSRQPYHAGFGTARTDERALARLVGLVRRYARLSLDELFDEYRAAGHPLRGVGLVVGSQVDPETIASPHMRAHAAEGRLYRTLVEDAARRRRLPVLLLIEREQYATAERRLGRAVSDLRRALERLRPEAPGPWRAEEKAAALAAWLTLRMRPAAGSVTRRRRPAP
jgi:hypothetical protein